MSARLTVAPDALGTAIGEAIAETRGYIARHDARPTGMPVALYHIGTPEDEALAIEVGWPVAAALPAEGRIGIGTIGGVTVARTIHRGPYDTVSGAFAAITDWLVARGHETAGTPWEVYRSDPGDVHDPRDLITEVCWPIR